MRTSLALAIISQQPFQLDNIRANRRTPGLRHQHLAAVNAAAEICDATVSGARLGSQFIKFRPGNIKSGDYSFDIGSAGSTTLVLQTVLFPLLSTNRACSITISGGTHNPMAPPFDFIRDTFFPVLDEMGMHVQGSLERCGFFPAGGGKIQIQTNEMSNVSSLNITERGNIKRIETRVLLANLPQHIAEREIEILRKTLGEKSDYKVEVVESGGPGNAIVIKQKNDHITMTFTAFGKKGLPALRLAEDVIRQWKFYNTSDAPVDSYLADQLLLPLALAGSGEFVTTEPTQHTQTSKFIIEQFLDIQFAIKQRNEQQWSISL